MQWTGLGADDWPQEADAWFDLPDELGDDLGEVLREVLDGEYDEAGAGELGEALDSMLESMSPAEAFSFSKALGQIQRAAGSVVSDPAFGQVVRTALPMAGGALGTVIGGPAGTAIGTSLGSTAAKSLSARPTATKASPAAAGPVVRPTTTPVAGGSAAAAQGLVLTQQPDVLKGLLALAMGQHGQKTVSGVPVAAIMNMLSSVFAQSAADADQLMYLEEGADAEDTGVDLSGRAMYLALLDADNQDLVDALEAS